MRLFAGTSGFSYKEWKGSFYPDDLADKARLAYYAERLPAVEINNTFYRMPRAELFERWTTEVPEDFVFVIKASQRITHRARLKDVGDPMGYLWHATESLGRHRGPLLFQLPPYFRKDVDTLRTFLGELPDACRATFEFRHGSWAEDDVHDALREHGAALCVADMDGGDDPPIVATADWGYLRLRRAAYADEQLEEWARRILAQDWKEVFVFFKHEDEGSAPQMASAFIDVFRRLQGE